MQVGIPYKQAYTYVGKQLHIKIQACIQARRRTDRLMMIGTVIPVEKHTHNHIFAQSHSQTNRQANKYT